ncbi:MAG: hypothetical protein H0T78_01650 [Longispora sp.]|nr:hypothetical protein [Longispora sp. (in: high G+C Gram-positive bacteria)]
MRHSESLRTGVLRVVDGLRIPVSPSTSMRSLVAGDGTVVKVSLDVQITSTRRSMSLATARNGPGLSVLVEELLAGTGMMLAEYAGAGARLEASERDVTALLRRGLGGIVAHGEVAVPATALPAMCPFTGRAIVSMLVDESGLGQEGFLAEYAAILLGPVMRLSAHGMGLEAHLQNCVPVFVSGRPVRMVFRDLGGVRLHAGRLADGGHEVRLWPGSVTATDRIADMHAKVIYTVFANHLAAIVEALGLGKEGWDVIAEAVRAASGPLLEDTRLAAAAAEDLTAVTARPWAYKALLTMRLRGGDVYVPVDNPLAS